MIICLTSCFVARIVRSLLKDIVKVKIYHFSSIHQNSLLLHLPIIIALKLDKERRISRNRVHLDKYSPRIPSSHLRDTFLSNDLHFSVNFLN